MGVTLSLSLSQDFVPQKTKQIRADLEQTCRFICENRCWLWVLIVGFDWFDYGCRSTL